LGAVCITDVTGIQSGWVGAVWQLRGGTGVGPWDAQPGRAQPPPRGSPIGEAELAKTATKAVMGRGNR